MLRHAALAWLLFCFGLGVDEVVFKDFADATLLVLYHLAHVNDQCEITAHLVRLCPLVMTCIRLLLILRLNATLLLMLLLGGLG